jgi:Fe-S cluster assembly ATP-binding protein
VSTLEIKDLHVSVEDKVILKGIDLVVRSGEVHAIMGPNGSGKSTLSLAIMGHPRYKVTKGSVLLDGADLLSLPVDERARKGLFLAFQYPSAIPGVSVANFLRTAINARRSTPGAEKKNDMPIPQFRKLLTEKMKQLEVPDDFLKRAVNDGFSGGEKKRLETLQMHMFQPTFAILDETDSGLDIDALRTIAQGIESLRGPDIGILLITHYERILRYVQPDFVHVLVDGRIVRTGGRELANELESKGYDFVRDELYKEPSADAAAGRGDPKEPAGVKS